MSLGSSWLRLALKINFCIVICSVAIELLHNLFCKNSARHNSGSRIAYEVVLHPEKKIKFQAI